MRTLRYATTSVVCLVAVVAAFWPMTSLVAQGSWTQHTVVGVASAVLLAVVLVAVRFPAVATLPFQLAVVTGYAWFVHVDRSEPLREELAVLFQQANDTLVRNPPPAPATTGLSFVIVLLVGALGVLAHYIGVSLDSPALAGVPIAGIYLTSAANTPQGIPVGPFVIGVTAWLMLVALGHRWGPHGAGVAHDTVHPPPFRVAAAVVTVLSLCASLVVADALPRSSPYFARDGLGRSSGGGQASVGLNDSADLTRSLQENDATQVLRYTIPAATTPPVLKVYSTSDYDDGEWTRGPSRSSQSYDGPADNLGPPLAPGLAESRPTISVTANALTGGALAVPSPMTALRVEGGWDYAADTGTARTAQEVENYSARYVQISPKARPTGTQVPREQFRRDLRVDERARPALQREMQRIPQGNTPFERASAIQDHLRDSPDFTYDLELADTRTGDDGRPVDPLTNFLLTRRGYCVQFASTMIMMARMEGIPARMALGYLPGTADGSDSYTVRQNDAHAWPELWFPGLGWTRFDPTPGSRSGDAPDYTQPERPDPTDLSTRTAREPETERPTATPSSTDPTAVSTTSDTTGTGSGSSFPVGRVLRWLVTLLVLGALVAALPVAHRVRRSRRLSGAKDPAHRAEVVWHDLLEDLTDLGVEVPRGKSPTDTADVIAQDRRLGDAGADRLRRMATSVTTSRYGRPGGDVPDLAEDAAAVLRRFREDAAPRTRIRAVLLPGEVLRDLLRRDRPE